jgi:hypothetical protein
VGASYTYSHATDEQSDMVLFYIGNDPLNLRSGNGNSDFDLTHVFKFTYLFELHNFFPRAFVEDKLADGWTFERITVLQSAQLHSVINYSGAGVPPGDNTLETNFISDGERKHPPVRQPWRCR